MEYSEPEISAVQALSDPCIYHYTSAEALLGILETNSLWASDLDSLNDPAELTHVRDVLEQVCCSHGLYKFLPSVPQLRGLVEDDPIPDELTATQDAYSQFILDIFGGLSNRTQSDWKNTVGRVFGVSFCSQGDLLSQWRGYGLNGGGVCIGFNATVLGNCFGTNVQLAKVEYTRTAQRDQIQKCLISAFQTYPEKLEKHTSTRRRSYPRPEDDALEESASNVLAAISEMAHVFKRPGFSEEQEYRLVYRISAESTDLDAVRLRAKSNQLIPFIPLVPVSGPLPIEHITQGPAYKSESADYAVRACLRRFGRPEATIKRSKYALR